MGAYVSENEELVCVDMSEADEDKPKHCNLASMLYDLGLQFPSCRTVHRDIYRTIVLFYMKLHNAWLLKTSSKKVTMDLDNTAKAVNHVKIESILVTISCMLGPTGYH